MLRSRRLAIARRRYGDGLAYSVAATPLVQRVPPDQGDEASHPNAEEWAQFEAAYRAATQVEDAPSPDEPPEEEPSAE